MVPTPPTPRGAVALGVAAGLLVIPQAVLLARAVDALFLRGAGPADIGTTLVVLAAVAAARAALTWASDARAMTAATDVKARVRAGLVRRVLAAPPAQRDEARTGALTATLTGGVEALDAYLASYRPQTVLAVVVPAAVGAAVMVLDPISGIVLGVTGPLIPLFMWLLGGAAAERTRAQWEDLTRLGARFLDAVQGLVTLKAFGRVDAEAAVLTERTDRFRRLTMAVLRVGFLSSLALELLATIGTALVAVGVGLRLLYDHLAFVDALAVLLLAPEFYRPLRALGASFHAGLAGRETLRQLSDLSLTLPDADVEDAAPPAPSRRAAPALVFDAVTVRHAPAHPPALADLTLEIGAGELVAVVGPSGGGKSTLLAALLGLVPLSGGRLLVDGEEPRLDGAAWRAGVTWVPQRPHLFHGTLADNLRLGVPEASTADLDAAVRLAAFEDVVAGLPAGLDTRLGEDGAGLSGGEAQRLALARAYLKSAPLVLLDEPTSDLDADTEARVLEGLRAMRAGRTVVLVTHRLAAARVADRVVRIEAGRVAP